MAGCCDSAGNFYFAGMFWSPGCAFQKITLGRNGINDLFIVKYNTDGKEVWVRQIGNDNPYWSESIKIFYNTVSHHLFIVGKFSGTIQMGTSSLTSSGMTDIFFSKYSLDGQCIWAKKVGGAGEDGNSCLAFDDQGNIYMSGTGSQSMNFGGFTIPKGGFLAKFDPEGNCIWAKNKFEWIPFFNSQIRPVGLKILGPDILLGGCMGADTIIHVDTLLISHPGYGSSLICCFDSTGMAKWIREGISKITESISGISIDDEGNIFHSGYFKDTIVFSGNVLTSTPGKREMFLVSYNKYGQFRWARPTLGGNYAEGYDLTATRDGRVAVVGHFRGLVQFGQFQVQSLSGEDMFIAGYDSLGNCLGVSNYANSYGTGICDDPAGNLYFTCLFNPSTTIGSQTYASYGALDIVVAKCSAITGIGDPEPGEEERLLIFANPTTGKCTVTLPAALQHEKDLVLRVFDSGGRQVGEYPLDQSAGKIQLNVEALAQGIYQVVVSGGGKVYSGKVVFKK